MEQGKELVYKLSRLRVWNIRIWGNCCNCIEPNYADQLAGLDRSLRILLEILKLEQMRNVQENLLLSRNHNDKQDELDKKMSELLKVHEEVVNAQQEMCDMMRVQNEAVHQAMQRIGADAVQNVRGDTAPAPALGLRSVFQMLCDVVIQVKVKISSSSWLQEFDKRVGHRRSLLILDDVWPGAEFEELKRSNFKILVTSRFEFPKFGPSYYVLIDDELREGR